MTRQPARRLVALLLAGVLALLAAGTASADDLDNRRQQKQAELNAAQAQQSQLQDSLEDLQGQVAQTGAQLVALQGQLPAAQAAVDAANAELDRTRREAALIAARLADAQQQQDELAATIASNTKQAARLRATIAQLGREAYRDGPDLGVLDVAMDATSTQDFVDGYAQMSTALRAQSKVLEQLDTVAATTQSSNNRLSAVKTKITDLKTDADQKVTEAAAAKKTADDAKTALDALTAQVAAQQAALQAQQADVAAQLAAADAATTQLNTDLVALIAQQRAQGQSAGVMVSGAVFADPTVHDPMVVTSEYGMRWQPILHIYRLHAGIDLRSYCNEPIYAARAGTVRWALYKAGYGNQVMVDHGWVNGTSLMSSYNHLNTMVVSAGQSVSTGQLVGYAGMTGGVSTACHLHFEVYINGSTVNPRPYLGI